MFKHLSKWNFLVVALLSFSVLLAACGDTATPTSTTNKPANAGALNVPTGVKTTLAANFPDTTTFYLSLNTDMNSGQIKSWQKIIDYLSQIPEVKQVTQNMDLLALANIGTYAADIKPWIGEELVIGLTDVNAVVNLATGAGSPTSSEYPVLLAASVKDQAKAEAFINKLSTQLSGLGLTAPTKETYKDATLYTFNLGIANVVAGLSKDKLVIGGGATLVKGAFDQAADKGLAKNIQFMNVASKLPTANLAFTYIDYQAIVKSVTSNPDFKNALAGLNATNLDYTASLGAAFSTADTGFRIDSYQTFLPEKTPPAVADQLKKAANPSNILTALPESTLAFMNSRDAASAYTQFVDGIKSMGANSSLDFTDSLNNFEKQSGLNVQNDIVSLFGGEYTVFVAPDAANKTIPVGFGLVTEATDKAAAQTKLDKIANAIEQNAKGQNAKGQVKWANKTVGSSTFRNAQITDPDSKTTVSANLGIAGDYAFFSLGDDSTAKLIDAATAPNADKGFTKGPNAANFDKVKANLPGDNTGYFYLDIQAVVKLATPFIPAGQEGDSVKAISDKLSKLTAIGSATHQSTTESLTTVFVYFPVTQ
jgi:hypothetical protein